MITEKNYLSQNVRPFLSIVGKVPETVTQIMFTRMLEWHWNITKNIQASNWVSIVRCVALKCFVQKAIKIRDVNCFLKLKAKF